MKHLAIAALACLALWGCNKSAPETVTADSPSTGSSGPKGGGDGIAPAGPNVGPITPVVGGDNMGGTSGGGVAQVMKERAKQTQNKATSATSGEDGSGQ
jgi:hypothetical protein